MSIVYGLILFLLIVSVLMYFVSLYAKEIIALQHKELIVVGLSICVLAVYLVYRLQPSKRFADSLLKSYDSGHPWDNCNKRN